MYKVNGQVAASTQFKLFAPNHKQKLYGQVKSRQYFTVVPPSLTPFLAPQLPLLLSISGVPTEKTFKAEHLLS